MINPIVIGAGAYFHLVAVDNTGEVIFYKFTWGDLLSVDMPSTESENTFVCNRYILSNA